MFHLLGKPESNVKLAKGGKFGWYNCGLSLAPANQSGYEVCASRSAGCTQACLFSSGLAHVFPSIQEARIKKTKMFFEEREKFISLLRRDLIAVIKNSGKLNLSPCVRLNVYSDILWEKIVPNLFYDFPEIQFYDYTKHYSRMKQFLAGKLPSNYHLTFSRSESNHYETNIILFLGGNVTFVFDKVPSYYHEYEVINGDESDLRFLDKKGVIVGLRSKGTQGVKNQDNFVIRLGTMRKAVAR